MSRMRTQIDEFLSTKLGLNDSGEARIYKTILDVIQDMNSLSMLYQAQSHKQLAKQTATKATSIRGLAAISGHNATRPISARGTVLLRKNESFSVGSYLNVSPSSSLICQTNNLPYIVNIDTEKKYSLSTNSLEIPLIQGKIKTQSFVIDATSEDTTLYTIRLDDEEYIENYSIKVKVNNVIWKKADSLLDMAFGDYEYIIKNGWQSQVDLMFGDSTHGTELKHGDLVEVEYLVTNGELGILTASDTFTIVEGFTNSNGDELTDFIITRNSGFMLASNGERSEVTRNLIGFSSRSLTFATPQNLKAYLSRLSILSHISVYSEKNNDLITHVLALPSLNFLNSRDYLNTSESFFRLSTIQKNAIKDMINNSRRQFPSSEIVLDDPILKRYSMLVYIRGEFDDDAQIKNGILDNISEIMLSATFKSIDMNFDNRIVNSEFVNSIFNMDEIESVKVNIFSEDNEQAKYNGFYFVDETVVEGASRLVTSVRKELRDGENPNIGLNNLNSIVVSDGQVPILRPIELYSNGTLRRVNDAVTVFVERNGIFKQL